MKRLIVFLSILVLLLSLTGCAASTPTGGTGSESPIAPTYANDESEGADAGSTSETGNLTPFQRKVIKNVTLELEAKDVEAAYADILAYATANGGYEFNRTQQTVNDTVRISAQIKIDPDNLEAFIAYIDGVCAIVRNQTSSEDVTSDYYDVQTRLQTMQKTLTTYYDFLENATTIDESLKVQKQIDDLTLQIESLKGQLNLWDSLLAESTVTIYLEQTSNPVETRREINWSALSWSDMGYLMQAGLTKLLNAIVVVLQWTAIILVILSPLWIIAIVVLLVVRRRRKLRQLKLEGGQALEKAQRAQDADTPKQGQS